MPLVLIRIEEASPASFANAVADFYGLVFSLFSITATERALIRSG